MDSSTLISTLDHNQHVFAAMFNSIFRALQVWKPTPEKWCALEIACHLQDEETEDFRTRTKHVLENPQTPPPQIDPTGWVKTRDYMGQDYDSVVANFLNERTKSINWLKSVSPGDLHRPNSFSSTLNRNGDFYLRNWVAHDFLHLKQLTKLRYDYLEATSEIEVDYAGRWT